MGKGIKTEEANSECGKYYDVLYSFTENVVKLNDMAANGETQKELQTRCMKILPAYITLCDGDVIEQPKPKAKPKTVLQVNLNTTDDWGICPTCGKKCIKVRENTILVDYPMYCSKCQHEYIVTWKSDLAKQKKERKEQVNDKQIIEAIRKIVEKGNNAEVKKRKDGSLVVYEVRKHVAAQ